MMPLIPCHNCRARNPEVRESCVRCNAPLTVRERERRERLREENELREANGKIPLPLSETDESIEPLEEPNDLYNMAVSGIFLLLVILLLLGIYVL